MPRKSCTGFMQTNYTALGSHFPFLKHCAWQSSVMESLKPAFAHGDYFHPIPLNISCTHHRFYLLWIFPLSLLVFLINHAGHAGFSTVKFPEKTISAFRSEWVYFLIRPKWQIKSWPKPYQTTPITITLRTFRGKKKMFFDIFLFSESNNL